MIALLPEMGFRDWGARRVLLLVCHQALWLLLLLLLLLMRRVCNSLLDSDEVLLLCPS
jgi:hypothetical protein